MHLDLELAYDFIADRVPPAIAAWVDRRRPRYRHPPLNGQTGRERLVRAIIRVIPFECVIETGTFRGSTTEYLAQLTSLPVKTVEAIPRYHAYARARLRRYPLVETRLGDSREFLRELVSRGEGRRTTLFYLDAHWQQDLPLREELEIITTTWARAVVIVDDFEVPGDPGYGFDDYGPKQRLTADYLSSAKLQRWSRFYPTVPSAEETGGRRGCIVIASPSLTDAVAPLPELRALAVPRPLADPYSTLDRGVPGGQPAEGGAHKGRGQAIVRASCERAHTRGMVMVHKAPVRSGRPTE